MVKQGLWLFGWRSYLPFLLLPFAAYAFLSSVWLEQRYGVAAENAWDIFCLLISLLGLAFRVVTVGAVPRDTSGRNTGRQRAKVLNSTGIYSTVRHPLYFGNFVVFLGFSLLLKSGFFLVVAVLAYVLYYERIILAEEEFLAGKHGAPYRAWARRTPVIIPRFSNWVPPSLPFSWRSALRREYHTLTLIAGVFLGFEILEAVVLKKTSLAAWFAQEPQWAYFAGVSAILYVAVTTIRKTTRWLSVPGR